MKAVDVMGFAGSMLAGVDQAGFDIIAKREPSAFKGFGVESVRYNAPWVESQVSAPEDWALPAERVELVYGCPPCSGFSQLSAMNVKIYEGTGTTYRGVDAEINECMVWLVAYAARVRPPVLILESVGAAFKLGQEWFETLWRKLRDETGLDYSLTHVRMNAALVGGDVIRPRYFMVAHLQPFGVGLEFVTPRPMREVLADLPAELDMKDTDWGHLTQQTGGPARLARTIEWLEEQGLEWRQGSRLPENLDGMDPPEFWYKERATKSKRYGDENGMSDVYSHWYSTDAFSPLRWRADRPFGVVVAATLDRAVHPLHPRTLTYREAARFMSLPDTWSLRVLTEKHKPAELGKAVPTASAKWIAHWAAQSILGAPGEYAGRDTADPQVRVINVTDRKAVEEVLRGNEADAFWPETSDPSPAAWIVDRKARPAEWWQRDDELGIFAGKAPRLPVQKPSRSEARTTQSAPPAKATRSSTGIVRIQPEAVATLLASLGLSKAEAAAKLGVSVSRVNELTTHVRPASWLNAARWEEVQAALRG